MKSEMVDKIVRQIKKSHPNFANATPKVTRQSQGHYLLLFSSETKMNGDKKISNVLRVVSNDDGEIIKVSSSRG